MNKDQLESFVETYHQVLLWRMPARHRTAPHFIGVGAGRVATSSLYAYLKSHPGVYLPPVKELNYFGFRTLESHPRGYSFAEYKNYFLAGQQGQQLGEFSPIYLSLPGALEQIKKYIPDCKIIVTIRDPIERAISHFMHHRPQHQIKDANEYFRQAVESYGRGKDEKFDWFAPVKSIRQSMYADDITRARSLFGAEQVYVLVFDDITADAQQALGRLCTFLDLPEHDFEFPKTNQSARAGKQLVISESTRDSMMGLFRGDIEKTGELIQRDLSAWTRATQT